MASITTILGTDSVSSSRIVLNNNFAALNQELADIAAVLNPTNQTLTLTGLVTGGLLKIKNTSNVETFKVNESDAVVNVPIEFTQDVQISKGLNHSVYYNATTLPAANAYTYTTYILDATAPAFVAQPATLAAANNGQEITLISNGGDVELDGSILIGVGGSNPIIHDEGSLTLRYSDDLGKFVIISIFNVGY